MEVLKDNDCLVSCVIPSYKRADTLERAINSVLNQTYQNIEILVVDDNIAGDNYSVQLERIVNSFKNDKVKLIKQPQHINGAAARNAGIKAAQGEFIAFLDDDDEWVANKVELQLYYLSMHPECGGASSLYKMYKGEDVMKICHPYNNDNLHYKILSRQVSVYTSTLLLRKRNLLLNGIFDENLLRGQDQQLLLDFTYNDTLYVVEDYLVKLHADSEINRPDVFKAIKNKQAFYESCKKHFFRYQKNERECAFAAHNFEIAYIAFQQKKYFLTMKYILKNGLNIKAYKAVIKRYKNRF